MAARFLLFFIVVFLTACASSPQWTSPLHEKLYTSQEYYKKAGRSDIGCFIGVNPETQKEDVICTEKIHIPAGAVQVPQRAYSPSSYAPSSGGSVRVKGYYRKNGTYVRPHTRRAPRRR
ncbi:MAG: hypothetical protein ACTJHW_15750 [Paenalcaligenes sp.]